MAENYSYLGDLYLMLKMIVKKLLGFIKNLLRLQIVSKYVGLSQDSLSKEISECYENFG